MSLLLFCLLVYFVHLIPHRSAIIWSLSFHDRLISLSIVFSRSIHAVVKCKIPFLFLEPSSIPLCECTTALLFTHLLIDTWTAFKFGQHSHIFEIKKEENYRCNSIYCKWSWKNYIHKYIATMLTIIIFGEEGMFERFAFIFYFYYFTIRIFM